jgi:hypothetical protein
MLLLALAACGDESAVIIDQGTPIADDFGECTLTLDVDGGGSCRVDWVCREAGVLSLVCRGGDAGAGCACINQTTGALTAVDATPDCGDLAALTDFARAQCGWSEL